MNIELIEQAAWKRAHALRLDLNGDMSTNNAASALEDARILVGVLRDIKALQDMKARVDILRGIYMRNGETKHSDIEF